MIEVLTGFTVNYKYKYDNLVYNHFISAKDYDHAKTLVENVSSSIKVTRITCSATKKQKKY